MGIWRSLSGRLLVLTVLFVMLAEVLIFVPSVARFREDYLRERMEKAQIASLAILAAKDAEISPELEQELIQNSEVFSVALKRGGARELMLMAPTPMMVDATYDLRDPSAITLIWDGVACLLGTKNEYVRIIGTPRFSGGDIVEIVIHEPTMRWAMLDYGLRILNLSLIISAITAGLVYLSVNFFLVRPMRRVIEGIVDFRENPEEGDRVIRPSGASGEIGLAERELAETQTEVRQALKHKSRLAALGQAVAKINHDLRNILASTQLLADRLEASKDPIVRRVAPKLVASLDRAIRLCRHTLEYGRADEPPPVRTPINVRALLDELSVALGVPGVSDAVKGAPAMARAGGEARAPTARAEPTSARGGPAFSYAAPADLIVDADADQLFRALLNLTRNAMQAIEASGAPGEVRIDVARTADGVRFDVVDDGPGLPDKAREHLFEPFRGSVRRGGSGLGLAIAAELVRGHGGALALVESTANGTRFRLTLPNADLSADGDADATSAASPSLIAAWTGARPR